MLVTGGQKVSCSYPTFDQATGLFVAVSIYDVTSGTPVFVSKINASDPLGIGIYEAEFVPVAGNAYLAIALVYTSNTYSTIDTSRAPQAKNYEAYLIDTSVLNFNYATYDQSPSISVVATVYDLTARTSVNVSMTHVLAGVYFGQYAGFVSKDYLVAKIPGTSGYSPSSEDFQTFKLASNGAVITDSGLDPMATAMEGLRVYLAAKLPGLTVLDGWPTANQALSYPSLTLTRGTPKRTPRMIEVISVTNPDGNGQVIATERVAEYEAHIQLDLWTGTKPDRSKWTNSIINAINAAEVDNTSGDPNPDGLSLVLSSYFSEIARYEIETSENVDDEAAAQRQERRQRIVVLVNVNEIRQRTYYAMVNIQGQLGVIATDSQMTDDASDTDQIINWPNFAGS